MQDGGVTDTSTATAAGPLGAEELLALDAYWRAANYLSVGQIYLLDNPLLREPLVAEHVKPRLLGHFGTVPGLNLIYAHLNRAIRTRDLDAIYVTGPGHGGPGVVANAYLEGTYSELYPHVGAGRSRPARALPPVLVPGRHPEPCRPRDARVDPRGRRARLRARTRRSAPPSTTRTCSWHAWSATARPRPGPLAASWHSTKFLNPRRDGAVLPILHLNGWKIDNPTVLSRIPDEELLALFEGYGWRAELVGGRRAGSGAPGVRRRARPGARRHRRAAARGARARRRRARPHWPMIVLRTPKGWTGPKEVDGAAGRGHVALAPGAGRRRRGRTTTTGACSRTGCGATGPRSSSTSTAASSRSWPRCAPRGDAAHEREPARERRRAAPRPRAAGLPRLRGRRARAGDDDERGDARPRRLPPRRDRPQPRDVPPLRPRRDGLEPARRRLRGHRQRLGGRDLARRRAPRAGRPRDGGAVRASLPGLARGLPADRAGTASSTATRPSSTSSTRCSTSTRSG